MQKMLCSLCEMREPSSDPAPAARACPVCLSPCRYLWWGASSPSPLPGASNTQYSTQMMCYGRTVHLNLILINQCHSNTFNKKQFTLNQKPNKRANQ